MACTLRIAADTARIGQPEINLGIIPGYGGTQRLPRLVGKGVALELLLTGRHVTAAEALQIGLVNRVVPAADLMAEAKALAAELAGKAPIAVQYIIEAVQSRPRGVVRQGTIPRSHAVRPGRVDRRHARRHEGVSREAQAGLQRANERTARIAVRIRLPLCHRRLTVQRGDHGRSAQRRAAGAGGRRRCARTTSPSCACRARSRFRSTALRAAETGQLRRRDLPRLPDQGRDDALRIHRRQRSARRSRTPPRRPASRWHSAC